MKRKEVVLSNQSSPLPQKRDCKSHGSYPLDQIFIWRGFSSPALVGFFSITAPSVMQNQPSPDLQRRIHSQRKRRRDVREVFEPNEGTLSPPTPFSLSPSLSNYKKAMIDRTSLSMQVSSLWVLGEPARTRQRTKSPLKLKNWNYPLQFLFQLQLRNPLMKKLWTI